MENVMLNSIQTQIKIVDFGLSNVWSADNPLRTHCGSPEYAAPELFVTGKQYGAEVDLWSLGIILYGMVQGQLPFVSSRVDYTSSLERRKKLVAKINKGLAAAHRRSLAAYSSEFRHVLGRLLAADSSARLSTKELMVHPWITDKGRRLVRTNPIKTLDSHWQAKIITEIGTLLQADPKTVMSAIAQNPLGKVGGMFNILVHKHQINQLCGDGVTRTLPSLTAVEFPSEKHINGPMSLRVSTARTGQVNRPGTVNTRQSVMFTPRGVERQNLKISINLQTNSSTVKHKASDTSASKKENNVPKVRPNSVQPEKNSPIPDYRGIKECTLRRKAYSATVTPKLANSTCSPVVEQRKHISTLPMKTLSPKEGDVRKKGVELSSMGMGKKCIQEALNVVRKVPHILSIQQFPNRNQQHRDSHLRIQTANAEKQRCNQQPSSHNQQHRDSHLRIQTANAEKQRSNQQSSSHNQQHRDSHLRIQTANAEKQQSNQQQCSHNQQHRDSPLRLLTANAEKQRCNQQLSSRNQQYRDSHLRIQTANAEKPRSKSDHLTGTKRPFTGPVNRLVSSIKHTSAPPVTVSYSLSRTIDNRLSLNMRPSKQKRDVVNSRPGPWERSMMACGDASPRNTQVTTTVKPTKTIICDPIARSIADYVEKNVPSRLHNFSWFNKKQS